MSLRLRLVYLCALLRWMLWTRTYSGLIVGQTVWLDGAILKKAKLVGCHCVYFGLGSVTIEPGVTELTICTFVGPERTCRGMIAALKHEALKTALRKTAVTLQPPSPP